MTPVVGSAEALELFHPLVARWFREEVGEPTEVQSLAWPAIAGGEHVLVTAPTGSGKTLTAFLWALNQLLTGAWPGGRLRVLYVSPLKALNNDVRRNLLGPLAALEARFAAAGEPAAPVRVLTRSGDTPGSERQKMVRHPPEILITTPESLNILLTSKGGRSILDGIGCVILDEIHAVAAGKRGTHLITAVERLVPLAGEFQRIALSATIRPPERVARFVGGYELSKGGGSAGYRPRRVRVIRSSVKKEYDLRVCVAEGAALPDSLARVDSRVDADEERAALPVPENPWEALTGDFKKRIAQNRSTLLFANSRRTTEKITRLLNGDQPTELAYSHHGSLSRELRSVVERRLKEGRLSAIVSTNSLELGIDIGSLDEVILIQTPPTLASAVQRIGRSGHGVGEVSRGRLYPLFGRDLIESAVVASGVLDQAIEEVEPVTGALDVLAQVILSMTAAEGWDVDELFDFVRTSYPYRELKRRQFDLVLEMLSGRYADSRLRELEPRVSLDRVDNTVRARRGAARLIYLSGGTIPDRGYFQLRHHKTMAMLGELDEEFVWERSLGDTFSLGAQSWRIQRITHNDVLVVPAYKSAAMAPFWRAEGRNRGAFLSDRIARFLERAEVFLAAGKRDELARVLGDEHRMEPEAAAQLIGLLERQRAATERPLPHRHHLLIEKLAESDSDDDRRRFIFHTLWGGRVNRPLAMALEVAWQRRHGVPLEIESENDCLMVSLPRGFEPVELLELVRGDNVESLLRDRLERTGFFGARFRENAGRALLLPRSGYRRRVPLWLNRQRAKKLLESVSRYEDFPILFETWRTCLSDEFELEPLKVMLDELAREKIRVSETRTSAPSPFAANLIWQQTNRLMYEDDVPEGDASALRGDLLKELVFSSSLRPEIPAELLDVFQRKLHRTYPGYAPRTAAELLDWIRERLVIPLGEWRRLLAAVEADLDREIDPEVGLAGLLEEIGPKAVRLRREAGAEAVVVAIESLPRLFAAAAFERSRVGIEALGEDAAPPDVEPLLERLGRRRQPAPEPAEQRESLAAEDQSEDPFIDLLAEWLRFYGPIPRQLPAAAFDVAEERLGEALATLVEGERLVIDRFGPETGAAVEEPPEICDAENLERLLRILRSSRRPPFEPLPLERLPLHLASWQGIGSQGAGLHELQRALEALFGWPAPAGLWESDLLPARLEPYYPSWLDSLLAESDLIWTGSGKEKLTFLFPGDLELLDRSPRSHDSRLLPADGSRAGFDELARDAGLDEGELSERLWNEAWRGAATNTGFAAVRTAVLNRFQPSGATAAERPRPAAAPRRGRPSRRRFERWRASRPFTGDWYRLPDGGESEPLDALDLEELNKERVRVLLDRYGVLFRELLERELPAFRWSKIFRSLRLMELSGEVLAGQFFEGVPGLQFASRAAYRRLRAGIPEDTIFWMNALDPASPCGLVLDELRGLYPRRVPSSHLVFHGSGLVVASKRNGGELDIAVDPEHPHLIDYLGFLKVLLTRQFNPLKVIEVETINSTPAPASPYAPRIAAAFSSTRDHRTLKLRRQY